jgi:hypothetical protein
LQRDVSLDREDIGQLAIVGLGPQVLIGANVDELDNDAHAITSFAHAPVEDGIGTECRADLLQTLLPILEAHHRRAGNHLERSNLRQMRDDVVGDPVGEIVVLGIRAEIGEGQHCDRR